MLKAWMGCFLLMTNVALATPSASHQSATMEHPGADGKIDLTHDFVAWLKAFDHRATCLQKIKGYIDNAVQMVRDEMPRLGADLAQPLSPNLFKRWMARYRAAEARVQRRKKDAPYEPAPYFECKETRELSHAYFCIFYDIYYMNIALARASLYAEGDFGVPKGTVVEQTDDRLMEGINSIAGHDLTGKDLLAFEREAKKECATDKLKCLSGPERIFFAALARKVPPDSDRWVVIASPSTETPDRAGDAALAASHEIKHAQYFLQPDYRNIIDHYWDKVMTPQQIQIAKAALRDTYDLNNPYITKNEFQAYLLETAGKNDRMYRLVPELEPQITRDLERAGTPPIPVSTQGATLDTRDMTCQ